MARLLITPPEIPLVVNGRYLTRRDLPYLVIGDSPWSLIPQLSEADQDTYLTDTRNKGFTAVLLQLLERIWTTNAPNTIDGIAPFTTVDDFATPNPAYFNRAEHAIAKADSLGLQVWLCTNYIGAGAGVDHPPQGWYDVMVANGATKMQAWGAFCATRFRRFDNIVWVHGGDEQPTQTGGVAALLKSVYLGIQSVSKKWRHAYHCGGGTPGPNVEAIQYWNADPWPQINNFTTQPGSFGDEPSRSDTAYARSSPVYPFIHIEGGYEHMPRGGGGMTEKQCRAMSYWSLMRGARGVFFGNDPCWHLNGDSTYSDGRIWQDELNSPARSHYAIGVRTALLERGDWYDAAPATILTAGASSGTDIALSMRQSAGNWTLTYIPSIRQVTVDMTQLSPSSVRRRWLDPTNGTYSSAGANIPNTGTQNFTPPANATGTGDMVLVLDAA